MAKALASYRCGPGSIPAPSVHKWVESVVGFVFLAPRVFLKVLLFSSHLKKQHSKFQFDLMHVHFVTSSKLPRGTWLNK